MSTSPETQSSDTIEKQPLTLDISVESPQACLREVVVTIPQAEVKRYLKDAYDELVPEAQVPGFRSGRAPRQLVEKQFKDRVVEQVKGSLLMDSLAQVTDSKEFSAIGEPDFDYEAIKIPDEGDFKFQFQIEVRPEFKTPKWKGAKLTKPVEEVGETEINDSLNRVLARYATWEATDEAAEMGDKLLITATFSRDGKQLSEMDEERVTLEPRLSFTDGVCEDFGKQLVGAIEGDSRKIKIKVAEGVADEALRGAEIDGEIQVIEVCKHEPPALTPQFLEELGDFESEAELKEFVKSSLVRQADYRTQQAIRQSVVELLAGSADFQLPKTLVQRQTQRELERRVLELRRSGFDEDSIRSFVNAAHQNAQATTEASLREHFILEQIAEEENIDADEEDFENEIALIAQQSDMPPRRVRARLEKQGQMDALRNQIVERKVIELIVAGADVTEEKVKNADGESSDVFALYHSVLATKNDDAIPQAKYDDSTPAAGDEQAKDKDKD